MFALEKMMQDTREVLRCVCLKEIVMETTWNSCSKTVL